MDNDCVGNINHLGTSYDVSFGVGGVSLLINDVSFLK